MPHMRFSNATATVNFRPADAPTRINVPCPKCEATPGGWCFKLNSWVSTSVTDPTKGFYTERMKGFHPERRTARPDVRASDPRVEARRELRSLTQRKLTGNDRMQARRWAGTVTRTAEELAAKVAELQALPDLPW